MGEAIRIPFFDLFSSCRGDEKLRPVLEKSFVLSAEVDKASRTMQVKLDTPEPLAPVMFALIEQEIAAEFSLCGVKLISAYKPQEIKKQSKAKEKSGSGTLLMGRPIKKEPVRMETLSLDSGEVVIQGKVFGTDSREITKRNAYVLSFCLTDGTGSIKVSKYMRDTDGDCGIIGQIKDGMYLTVCGSVSYNRFDDDMTLEPRHIQIAEAPQPRQDTAAEKRVELHLHTSFSTMDALTNVGEAVKRAAKWGHKALAITDHGCAQAYPDAWHAAEKAGIKVIYGLEGYYINDVDEKLAIHGDSALPLETEYVAFDLECTGLRSDRDRITEIGAVVFSGGEIRDTFNTFVDPHMPIPPEVVKLTGITDEDVKGAPEEGEALQAFLDFAGERPLIAHNADFDVGFLSAAATRCNIAFKPVYLDTLVLAQTLLPHLKRHRLDTVSNYLSLPDFNHHRASDDAMVVARIMEKFIPMLQEKGAE